MTEKLFSHTRQEFARDRPVQKNVVLHPEQRIN